MTKIRVLVAGIEEADDGIAEFWCAGELMAVTEISENALQLRIAPRADGLPWVVDTSSLAEGLVEAMRQLDTYGMRASAGDPTVL
jgi:hypothetical protein